MPHPAGRLRLPRPNETRRLDFSGRRVASLPHCSSGGTTSTLKSVTSYAPLNSRQIGRQWIYNLCPRLVTSYVALNLRRIGISCRENYQNLFTSHNRGPAEIMNSKIKATIVPNFSALFSFFLNSFRVAIGIARDTKL